MRGKKRWINMLNLTKTNKIVWKWIIFIKCLKIKVNNFYWHMRANAASENISMEIKNIEQYLIRIIVWLILIKIFKRNIYAILKELKIYLKLFKY